MEGILLVFIMIVFFGFGFFVIYRFTRFIDKNRPGYNVRHEHDKKVREEKAAMKNTKKSGTNKHHQTMDKRAHL